MAKTALPNLSESLVVISLIIKVVQLVGEPTTLTAQFPLFFKNASALSLILFGLSLLLWLNSSRKGLEKVETMAQRVEEIKKEFDDVDRIARYGRGPVHLASLLRSQGFLHGQAGGETLAEVFLNTYAGVAEDLYALTQGLKDRVEFVEYHIVDKFLLNLMRNLPTGSVWLGTTRLQNQGAWRKETQNRRTLSFKNLSSAELANRRFTTFAFGASTAPKGAATWNRSCGPRATLGYANGLALNQPYPAARRHTEEPGF